MVDLVKDRQRPFGAQRVYVAAEQAHRIGIESVANIDGHRLTKLTVQPRPTSAC